MNRESKRLPGPAHVVFMVGRGWRFAELMAMSADEFMFWFDAQEAAVKAEAETMRSANKRNRR